MIAKIVARAGFVDLEDSSIIKQILAVVAREIDDSNYQLTRLQDVFSFDRATGADLDARAAEIVPSGLTRIQPQNAIGYLIFSRATNTGTISIPAGTIVRTSTGISVRTIQQGIISATSPEQITGHGVGRDSNLVPALAEVSGTLGNIAAGTAVKFAGRPPGINEVTNPGDFVRGRNAETDDEFRARIRLYLSSLAACTVDALKYAALGQQLTNGQQVLYAHVAEDFTRPGYATVYIDDGTGSAETYLNAAPSGTGGTFSAVGAGNVQTFTHSAGVFRAEHVGRTITFSGTAVAGNAGTYTITSVLGTTQVTYVNATAGAGASVDATASFAISFEIVTPTSGAIGGEEYLSLVHSPVRISSGVTLRRNNVALAAGTDYNLNPANGLIRFTTALSAGDVITASYAYYTGLIELVQRVIDGDPNDRLTFPGVRPAGVVVRVTMPTIVPLTIRVGLTIARGYVVSAVRTAVETEIFDYINGLGISGDVIRNEIIQLVMQVPGVVDCVLDLPTNNIVVADSELPRVTLNNIDIY